MKRIKCIFLATLLVIGAAASYPVKAEAASAPQGMKLVSENEYLALYINEEDASVAVFDKEGANYWYTNPLNADEDAIASKYYKRALKNQLSVQFFNENVQSQTMDSYADCVSNGAFSIAESGNGVSVLYNFGKTASTLTIPEAISFERMSMFTEKMAEKELKKVNRNYTLVEWTSLKDDEKDTYLERFPGYEGKSFYVLRGGIKDYLKEEIAGYFFNAGYTEEELEFDANEAGGVEGESQDPWFDITLKYELDGRNLCVSVPIEELSYNDNGFYLTSINILPYFGAASGEDGYMLVPDGSGALLRFDNGKVAYPSYIASVYGNDITKLILSEKAGEMEDSFSIKMPVFGIKKDNGALFAIIESGDALATINADVSGRTSSYNNIYAGFSYLQYGPVSLGDMYGANSYQLYSCEGPSEDYSIRYSFLGREEADYVSMAKCYREYLIDRGVLTDRVSAENPLFTAEFIGAIDTYASFAGIKYSATRALTPFDEAEDVINRLTENGISNKAVVYDGWSTGGIRGAAASNDKAIAKLSSKEKLKDFVKNLSGNGTSVYLTEDLQYVYDDLAFDGYSELSDAPCYFDHTKVKAFEYGIANRETEGKLASVVSPRFIGRFIDYSVDAMDKYEGAGINIGTASWNLYSDLLESRYTDRAMAKKLYETESEKLLGHADKILCDNANAYAWRNADSIMNIPLYSNDTRILDEEIPFYGMVLHGYVEFTGEPLNMADDYRESLARAVECGAGLHYLWITRENSELKETDYDNLYSVNADNWFDTAVNDYARVREVLGGLEDKEITGHEMLSNGITIVTYEDGTEIFINFNSNATRYDGLDIDGFGFVARKGE